MVGNGVMGTGAGNWPYLALFGLICLYLALFGLICPYLASIQCSIEPVGPLVLVNQ